MTVERSEKFGKDDTVNSRADALTDFQAVPGSIGAGVLERIWRELSGLIAVSSPARLRVAG